MTLASAAELRIGVFGGSFDPPHIGHAALIQAAIAEIGLDQLRVIPTGHAWHKSRPLSPAHHRMAMAQLAFSSTPGVVVDSREIQRIGPSYSVDTLREISLQYPGAKLFLIMGEDQARALQTWHKWQDVLQLAIICVAGREDLTGTVPQFNAPESYESRFRRLQLPAMPVSATEIRTLIAAHQRVGPLVFEPVARYIDDHHLYQTT